MVVVKSVPRIPAFEMVTVANVIESVPRVDVLKLVNAVGVDVALVTTVEPGATVAETGAADVTTLPEVMFSITMAGLPLSFTVPLNAIVPPTVARPEALVKMMPLNCSPPANALTAGLLPKPAVAKLLI